MRTRVGAVAVALLIVLAGCSGAISGSGQDGDNGDGESTEFLAPGVTADGVENVSLLVDRHFEILEAESDGGTYVASVDWNTTIDGVVTKEFDSRYVVDYPDQQYYEGTRSDYTGGSTETTSTEHWVTASDSLRQHTAANGSVTYDSRDAPASVAHPLRLEKQVEAVFGAVSATYDDVTVEEWTEAGTTRYVLENEIEDESTGEVRTAAVHIREDGLLTHATETSSFQTSDGETDRFRSELEFDVRPDASLERPEWYEAARSATADE